MLGLLVPVNCLSSPKGQPSIIRLISSDSEITAATDTNDLAPTAPCSFVNNGGVEHGPLRLYGLAVLRNAMEALPEVGIKDRAYWGLWKKFPMNPHHTHGYTMSEHHLLVPLTKW